MLSSLARAKDRSKSEETVTIIVKENLGLPQKVRKRKQGLNSHKNNDASIKHLEEKHHSKIF